METGFHENSTLKVKKSIRAFTKKHGGRVKKKLCGSWRQARVTLRAWEVLKIFTFKKKTHFGSSTVTIPLGCTSIDFPQNLSFGCMLPWKTKSSLSAWKAETGGWCETCSHIILRTNKTFVLNKISQWSFKKLLIWINYYIFLWN